MILSILKIIGIVILVILALLILILGILLFVPIRYQFEAEYKENPKADVSFKWAPILLKVTANYRDSKFEYIVRMFGGVVMTNTDIPLSWLGKKFFVSANKEVDDDLGDADVEDEIEFAHSRKNVVSDESYSENIKNVVIVEEEKEPEHSLEHKEPAFEMDAEKSKVVVKKKKSIKDKKSFFDKLQQKIYNIKMKVNQFIYKLRKLNDKREALLKVYHSKRFELAKRDIILYINTLWSVIRPKKLEGYMHLGFEDPATTGQVLGVLAMFLVWYDRFFTIDPDFEHACIDGYLNGSGKFRLFPIIKLLIKIILNKNLIKVIKKVQTIIEA